MNEGRNIHKLGDSVLLWHIKNSPQRSREDEGMNFGVKPNRIQFLAPSYDFLGKSISPTSLSLFLKRKE